MRCFWLSPRGRPPRRRITRLPGSGRTRRPRKSAWTPPSSTTPSQFMKSHETTSPRRDFSDQEIVNGKLLASIPTERAGTNGLVIRRGYVVAEWGDTERPDPTYSVAKSMLSTIAGIALDRGLIGNVDEPGCGAHQGRRIRFAAEQPRHLAPPPPAGIGVGRRDVGQKRELHRHGSVRPRRAETARDSGARRVLRIQRRADQPLRAVAAADFQETDSRRVPRRGDESDRRLVHVEMGALHERLRRHRRQAHGIGVGRHALGRRRVDQQLRHGAVRVAVAAQRQVGQQADRVARLT